MTTSEQREVERLTDELRVVSEQRDMVALNWRRLYYRAINVANGLTNYVEERPELRRAERDLDAIDREARDLEGGK